MSESEHERPKIDVSKAVGEGGHEVEQLGYEGVPDTGPITGHDEPERDVDAEIDRVTDEAALD